MKKFLILGNFLLTALILRSQSDYFLFVQSENNQPYYVQTDGKTISSSAMGHLIISGLKDSVYILNIGFPKNQFPEQLFQVGINRTDAGYQLKNLGAEGWVLFNFQTLQLIKARQGESKKQTISYGDMKKTDVFSTLMAALVNDSAVLYTSIVKIDPVQDNSPTGISDTPVTTISVAGQQEDLRKDSPVSVSASIKHDEITEKDTLLTKTDIKRSDSVERDTALGRINIAKQGGVSGKDSLLNNNVVIPQIPAGPDKEQVSDSLVKVPGKQPEFKSGEQKPLIIWFSETKTNGGTELVFFDMSAGEKIDTIRILISNEKISTTDEKNNNVKKQEDSIDKSEGKIGEQRSGAGKFIGRIFGKKDPKPAKSDTAVGKAESNQKMSSIKVTTIEKSIPADTGVAESRKTIDKEKPADIKSDDKKSDQQTAAGKLITKIFGKKNNSEPADTSKKAEPAQSIPEVKVTTIENQPTRDSLVSTNSAGKKKKETDTKKTEEQKSGAGKLIAKVFGKKSSENDSKRDSSDEMQSSIRVTASSTPADPNKGKKNGVQITNSDCSEFASNNDVDKLRVRMLGEKESDGQVAEARKFFKAKCFSTAQIRSLSTLFRTDEGKYKLFDAAYPFVSDSNNFKDLAVLLSDEYYINRFKAMVRM